MVPHIPSIAATEPNRTELFDTHLNPPFNGLNGLQRIYIELQGAPAQRLYMHPNHSEGETNGSNGSKSNGSDPDGSHDGAGGLTSARRRRWRARQSKPAGGVRLEGADRPGLVEQRALVLGLRLASTRLAPFIGPVVR